MLAELVLGELSLANRVLGAKLSAPASPSRLLLRQFHIGEALRASLVRPTNSDSDSTALRPEIVIFPAILMSAEPAEYRPM